MSWRSRRSEAFIAEAKYPNRCRACGHMTLRGQKVLFDRSGDKWHVERCFDGDDNRCQTKQEARDAARAAEEARLAALLDMSQQEMVGERKSLDHWEIAVPVVGPIESEQEIERALAAHRSGGYLALRSYNYEYLGMLEDGRVHARVHEYLHD